MSDTTIINKLNSLPDKVREIFELEISKEYDLWIFKYHSSFNNLKQKDDRHNECFHTSENFETALDNTIEWLKKYT